MIAETDSGPPPTISSLLLDAIAFQKLKTKELFHVVPIRAYW